MSITVYGVAEKSKNIVSYATTPIPDLLYDEYKRSGLLNDLESEFDRSSDKSDYDNFEDYCENYFPSSDFEDYFDLTKEGKLDDIHFNEKNWQDTMIFLDNEDTFPAKNLCLISAEVSNESSLQRVDLLYLRSDGKILPAEIKVSDNGRDVHGQLIRYMAGFSKDKFSIEKITDMAKNKLKQNLANLEDFIDKHRIDDESISILETTGLVICEKFHNDTITAIRYLNEKTQIDIKMFDIDLIVSHKWEKNDDKFIFKIELNEVV